MSFESRLLSLHESHQRLIERPNPVDDTWYNGIYERYTHPVLTAAHVPLDWRFDLDPTANPRLLERLGINA